MHHATINGQHAAHRGSPSKLLRCAWLAGLSLAFTTTAAADVLRVPGDAPTIQQAIDLAQPFDIVLVAPDTYLESIQMVGKGCSLVADGGTVRVGTIIIQNVPAGETAVLSGFQGFAGLIESPGTLPGLVVRSNAGVVRIENGEFSGEAGTIGKFLIGTPSVDGARGASVVLSNSVSFTHCLFRGGTGASLLDEDFDGSPSDGGDGLGISGSSASFFDCEMRGGLGGRVDDTTIAGPGEGGAGFSAREAARVQVHGSLVQGGAGGSAACDFFAGLCGDGGSGGDAVTLFDLDTQLYLREVNLVAGLGGQDGDNQDTGPDGEGVNTDDIANWSTFSERATALAVNTPVREGEDLLLSIAGQPGDFVRLYVSLLGGEVELLGRQGSFLLGFPLALSGVPLGTLPPGGLAQVPITLPDLGPGIEGLDVHLQLIIDDGNTVLLGPAQVSTLLDAAF